MGTIDQNEIKKSLHYIETQMYKPNLTQEEKQKLIKKGLFCVRNELPENNRANIVLGKLYYLNGNYLASRIQFNRAKNKNPNMPTIYYGLYKNYVMEGKWQEALNNLNTYIDMIQDNKRVDGFNIIIALLKYLTNQDASLEIPLDIYLTQELKDEKLESMYEELIESIIRGLYTKAIDLANSCEEHSRLVGNFCEFLTLEKILRSSLNKQRIESRRYMSTAVNDALANKDYKQLYYLLYADMVNQYHVLDIDKYIPILIENGCHLEAKKLLTNAEFKQPKHKSKVIYRKIIREKELVDNYTDEEREYYYQSIDAIENALLAEDYVDAYDMASAACYKLEHPIFLYYLGLSLFFLEEYSEAITYLIGYNRRGGTKALESRYFLACSHKNLGQGKKYRERRRNYRRYCNLLNKKFKYSFLLYSYEPDEEISPFPYDEVHKIVNNTDYISIKELLKYGNIKEANKKIDELARKKDKTEEDKKVLKYINANKKILSNQKNK